MANRKKNNRKNNRKNNGKTIGKLREQLKVETSKMKGKILTSPARPDPEDEPVVPPDCTGCRYFRLLSKSKKRKGEYCIYQTVHEEAKAHDTIKKARKKNGHCTEDGIHFSAVFGSRISDIVQPLREKTVGLIPRNTD